MKNYSCLMCSYIYYPEKGDLSGGVEPAVRHGQMDELLLESGGGEDLVEPDEQLALFAVFFRPLNLRKGWTKVAFPPARSSSPPTSQIWLASTP